MRGRKLVVAVLAASLLLSGCWDRIEVEDQLYAVTIGVDKGETSRYRVSIRVPTISRLKTGVLGGQGMGEASRSSLVTAEADSVIQAVMMFNTSAARRVTVRHLRALVVGEELARSGLSDLWAEINRNGEFRQTAGFFVSRGTAQAVMKSANPPGEVNFGKVPEGLLLAEKHLHMAPPIRIHHMVNRSGSIGIDPFGPVMAMNPAVSGDGRLAGEQRSSALAGEVQRTGENPVEVAGTALFQDTRLVGYLTIDETQALLALRGEMGKAYITVPYKQGDESGVVIRFQQENLPKYIATLTPEGPRVQVKLLFEGEVLSSKLGFVDPQTKERVSRAAERYMEEQMNAVLEKVTAWETDPVGFGLLFRGRFATWPEWTRYNWRSRIHKLQVKVSAKMRLRRFGLVVGPTEVDGGR